jgi:hypothetical protein
MMASGGRASDRALSMEQLRIELEALAPRVRLGSGPAVSSASTFEYAADAAPLGWVHTVCGS